MLAELLSWKEASIHPRPVPEPVPALGPACQLLFLQTLSAPGASAGVCSDATLYQTSEASQSHDNSNLYPRWSPLSIQPVWSLILTQWASHTGPNISPSGPHTTASLPFHYPHPPLQLQSKLTYSLYLSSEYYILLSAFWDHGSPVVTLLLKFKNQNTPRVNGYSWLHTCPRLPCPPPPAPRTQPFAQG